MLRKIFLPSVLALGFSSIGLIKVANGQVSIDPLVKVSEARQGGAKGFVTVTNVSDEEFRARVYAVPFTYDREQGFREIETSEDDLSPYILYSPRELSVPPRATRRIRYSIKIPPERVGSELRAILFTETLEEKERQKSGDVTYIVEQVNRIGTTLYIRPKDLTQELSFESAKYMPSSDSIQLSVSNRGDATVRPEIDWTISKSGNKVATGVLEAFTIVEQAGRSVLISNPISSDSDDSTSKPKFLTAGNYTLKGQAKWLNFGEEESESFELSFTVP